METLIFTPKDPKKELERFAFREEAMRVLLSLPASDGIAVAVTVLMHAADSNPDQLRAVLNSTADKDGRRVRMGDVITKAMR